MQVLFWATAGAMTIAAMAAVFFPLRLHGRAAGVSGVLSYAVIAAIAAGTYMFIGTPEAVGTVPDAPHSTRSESTSKTSVERSKVAPSIASLIDGLEERLRQDPDDAGGWLLLAQSYEHLGRQDDASAAYEKARALGRTDPNLDEVLGSTAPAPGVRGSVTLSPEAASLVKPDDVVFVFARQESDDRMPVAALRRRAGELPFEFELTDRNAMIKDRLLSDREEVIVTASISPSGKAGDKSLQLGATSKPVSTDGSARVELTISSGMQIEEDENE